MRAAPPPQPNPPARRAEGVGRGAERGRRGPVLQGAPVRETAPDRDGGDRGAERLHRAPAQSVCTAMSVRRSSRQAGRTCTLHLGVLKTQGSSAVCADARRSPDRRRHLSVRRQLAAAREFLRAALICGPIGGDGRLRSEAYDRIDVLLVPLPPRPRERCVVASPHSNPESCVCDNPRNHRTREPVARINRCFRSAPSSGPQLSGDVRDPTPTSRMYIIQRFYGCSRRAAALGACGTGATRRVTRDQGGS